MATNINVDQLIINKLTEEQYLAAKNSGDIVDTELYATPDNEEENDGNEYLDYLKQFDQHCWKKEQLLYREKKTLGINGDIPLLYQVYYESITVNETTGEIIGHNTGYEDGVGISIDTKTTGTLATLLAGKYVESNSVFYYIPTTVTSTHFKAGTYDVVILASAYYTVTPEKYDGASEYVYSTNRNTYPDNEIVDGFKYEYIGIPFDNILKAPKIGTFSYIGTGTYGENNPTVFNFAAKPKYLIFVDYVHSNGEYTYAADSLYGAIVVNIADLGANNMPFQYSNNYAVVMKYSNNVFYWFSTKNALMQLNAAGYTYRGFVLY